LNVPAETTAQMPSRISTTGDSCKRTYTVRYIEMTEEQESQWVRDMSLLCLDVYEENMQLGQNILVQCDTIPVL
jgi:hypothetical protein